MSLEETLDQILTEREDVIWEGIILNVNTLVSDAISVPAGQYRVFLNDANTCQLIPTNEAAKQDRYEVLRPTLAGFFNPEVHRKVVTAPNGKFIVENLIPPSRRPR